MFHCYFWTLKIDSAWMPVAARSRGPLMSLNTSRRFLFVKGGRSWENDRLRGHRTDDHPMPKGNTHTRNQVLTPPRQRRTCTTHQRIPFVEREDNVRPFGGAQESAKVLFRFPNALANHRERLHTVEIRSQFGR